MALVGYTAESRVCHNRAPYQVEVNRRYQTITDAIISGPVFIGDFKRDFDLAEEIVNRDFTNRFRDPQKNKRKARTLLAKDRSLGSVIKLLTPSKHDYTDDYNHWLSEIPQNVKNSSLLLSVLQRRLGQRLARAV